MTSHYKTGTHPFYIGMYIHIYTHIYVHIYTSQKECLHIFMWHGSIPVVVTLLGFGHFANHIFSASARNSHEPEQPNADASSIDLDNQQDSTPK